MANQITGCNGTTLTVGSKVECHQVGMKGCLAIIEALNHVHADITITKGNKTWKSGDKTTVGVWWIESK